VVVLERFLKLGKHLDTMLGVVVDGCLLLYVSLHSLQIDIEVADGSSRGSRTRQYTPVHVGGVDAVELVKG